MPKVRVHNFSISLDGFGAGPNQSFENPLGVGGTAVHEWVFKTDNFQSRHGSGEGGSTGVDNDFSKAAVVNVGAEVMGRAKFGPADRWQDENWRGWWGEETPFPHPIFVVSHTHRSSFATEDGTLFTFVPDLETGIAEAKDVAGNMDITIGGGASLINQGLAKGIVDEMHYVVSPVLLGSGARLFEGTENLSDLYEVAAVTPSDEVTHVQLHRKS